MRNNYELSETTGSIMFSEEQDKVNHNIYGIR
jgi:hypothetical protein